VSCQISAKQIPFSLPVHESELLPTVSQRIDERRPTYLTTLFILCKPADAIPLKEATALKLVSRY